MMTMVFSLELDSPDGGERNYQALEITRRGSVVMFTLLGMNNRTLAAGTCEPEELHRMAEILGEPEDPNT